MTQAPTTQAPTTQDSTTQVPTSVPLDQAVAFLEALGYGHVFGKGVSDDPLFPVEVEVTTGDGNIYALTGRIERAVRAYLRESGVPRKHARQVEETIRRELWSSDSYDELLTRTLCLVDAV